MKFKILIAVCIIAVISIRAYPSPAGEKDQRVNQTLSGLNRIGIVIENLSPDITQDGLTVSQIQSDIEQQLRQAGITTLTEKEVTETPGMPYLYVKVYTFKDDPDVYMYHITIELYQMVTLVRKPSLHQSAATWNTGVGGTVGKFKVAELRKIIKEYVGKFIAAYTSANQTIK